MKTKHLTSWREVGTLKIFLSRLATKESFWVFSGDEVELKITNRENPSILILASDPGTQDINSALYSSVLNRTLRLINSKHNLPGGIIADEFPTIYIHKIDNVVATARSNKVAVLLGLQEIPQLRQFYKKKLPTPFPPLSEISFQVPQGIKILWNGWRNCSEKSSRNPIPNPSPSKERRPASTKNGLYDSCRKNCDA
jgi:hypothetical protein